MQRGIRAATAALQGRWAAIWQARWQVLQRRSWRTSSVITRVLMTIQRQKAIAHAILGGVTAALQGNSAAAGAIGAGTGEVIASAIAKSLYRA